MILSHEVFPHLVFELMRIKLLHAVVDECQHGGARLKSEPLDEGLAWLEPSISLLIIVRFKFVEFVANNECDLVKSYLESDT